MPEEGFFQFRGLAYAVHGQYDRALPRGLER
jgi:hypothetical protein